ncbi:MAG: hypothetical protein RLZZ65_389 [Bacteroidota bacterium]|jgi:hypothetical protein
MKTFTKLGMLSILAFTMFSCAKPGCTDPLAQNYSTEAKKDDGTCTYSEKLIFWQDQATSQIVQNAGITGLYIYVDDQLVGSTLATNYWTGAPSCEQSGNVNTQIDMGSFNTKLIVYQVKDNNGNVLVTNTYTVTAGSCNVIQL